MNANRRPQVSFVLATHNRRAVVGNTLVQLSRCGLDRRDYEVVVVDNASTDGTPEVVAPRCDMLVRLRGNAGSCAKAFGIKRANGRFIVFLDDDSFPRPGSVTRMIERFEADPDLAAAGFTVHLPDGRQEGGALPDVFLGCGVGLRQVALRQAGGLDRSFFMQAEEYDLTFRLIGAGWRVKMFSDLHVEHLKTPCARKAERTTYYDIRNNLRLVARYLPSPFHEVYGKDWLQRYRWLAEVDGHGRAFTRGAKAGRWRGLLERRTYCNRRLGPEACEHFFLWKHTSHRMAELAASGAERIVFADLGKNVFAYHRAAQEAGITALAIGDDRFCAPKRTYRGVPVLPLKDALALGPDAVVVANSSPVHGTDTYRQLLAQVSQPVHHWHDSAGIPEGEVIDSATLVRVADSWSVHPVVATQDGVA